MGHKLNKRTSHQETHKIMRNLVSTFVKYPFYANMIIAFMLIAGGFAFNNMHMSFFPERSTTDIIVSVAYPGASPKEMEEGITTRVEMAVRGLVGIKEINSTSSENFARVTITTTGEYDIDETLTEVKNAVDGISSFPIDAEKPVIFKQRAVTMAAFVGLSGDVDLMTLKDMAQDIEDDLLASGVISQVSLGGYPALEISVEASEEDLMRYGLTFDEISRAIALNNRDISGGTIRSEDEEILIRSRNRSVDPDDIGDIVIRAQEDGGMLTIRDVATVKMKFADVPSGSTMNGQKSVSFNIQKLGTEDLKAISVFLNDYVKKFNDDHDHVKLEITYDFLELLKSRLHLLYNNGGIGLLLVLIALGLFLNIRLSLWVAWGIPSSFLGMFVIASMSGVTINMISLFGMILVIGILVDDGIVIAENIYSHFEKGKSPKKAAVDGTMEVLPAVVTSVLTTMIAFSPLLVAEGRMEFMYEMAFVVIASLGFSLLEAFFVLPAHLGSRHVLRSRVHEQESRNIRHYLDKFIALMRDRIYGHLLRHVMHWRWIYVFSPIALIIITAGMFGGGIIQSTFFPSIPFDSFNINVAFTPGSGEKQTKEFLDYFEQKVWEVNQDLMEEFNDTANFVDYTFQNLGNAFEGQENGAHAGNIFVLLRDMEDAPLSSFQIADRIRKKIGLVEKAEKFSIGGRNRFGSPVSVSLLGKDLDQLKKAKELMIAEMKSFEALKDVTDNNAIGKREVRLELKPKAYFLGLNLNDISQQVRQGFFGGQAQRMQSGKDEIRVWVRYPEQGRMSIGQMESMKIKTPRGEYPLSELVTYKIERGPVNIKRFNMQREVRIDADLVDPYEPVPPILERISSEIVPKLQAKYPGVNVMFQGQQRDSEETMGDLRKYYSIAFLLMVVIIMIHFKSFSQGLIILMMIPLGWLGSLWGHGIEGIPVSILSAWGMVALSGVIINDAVVFLQKYNSNLREGMKVKDALYNAGISRFRPIMLTTITTTVGLYPIILETSFQAQFLVPMAVSLAYGVMIGTGFILMFFPVLILALNDLRRLVFGWWYGRKMEAEEVEKAVIYQKKKIE